MFFFPRARESGHRIALGVLLLFGVGGEPILAAELAQIPLFLKSAFDPNILFNISLENPLSAAGYNDYLQGNQCGGREADNVAVCYSTHRSYIGYFDSNKCYQYTTDNGGYFYPVARADENHQCSKQFSGNFMNWATMLAISSFAYTLTGGERLVDDANAEAATTIVTREQSQDRLEGLIVKKRISNVLSDFSISTNQQFKLDPSTVSPWSTERVYIYNLMKSNKIRFGTTLGGGDLSTARYGADMRISVKVCDPHAIPSDPIHSLEPNCVAYSNGDFVWYKPEGLLQKYRNRARFGMMSLPLDEDYQGGVLRADIKYIGEKQVLSTGKTIENPNVEVAADGTFNTDPDHLADNNEYFDTQNSGVVNFINKFTQSGYRYYDTNSQIYYESLHYYKHNGSTPEYFPNSPPKVSTRFPFIRGSQWRDPIQSSCQKNFIVSIGDGYQWAGTRLPGTHYTSKMYKGDPMADGSYGEPGNADPDINVTALTNQLGIMEGISGKPFRIWCTSTGPWCGYLDPVVVNLGETLLSNRGETHYLAGLSYYGNTRDVRSDLSGKQTIKHFVVDVIENNDGDYQKHNLFNPLWMAGKYGFSEDVNQDGVLQVNEWDINRDGIPDGYIPADNPEQMYLGLSNALEYSVRAEKRAFSTMAASPEPLSDGAYVLYQSTFVSEEWWGDVQAIRFKLSDPSQKTVLWSAKDRLDRIDPANRNLYAVNPSAQQKKRGINLTWSSLTPSQQAALNAMIQVNDNLGENRLEYLRGDRSQEIAQGGAFRDRKSRLGDIVNSDTRFVGKWNYGYSELPGADGAAYAAYRASSAYLARPQMLLVGANDGFLHAFDAASGTELFGVMPNAVFNALSTLTSHFYSHHYFVDGQVSVSDAYINDQWTTVALASVGAGGRSVFAIDIGHPNRFSSTDILWEFDTTTDPDMGYVLGEAVTARLAGGQWVAIFPNGPGNQRGRAILYIVDLETGQLLKKVDFGRGSGQKENALFAPSVIDLNLDGIADTVYAGDAKGNLWKIDISGKTPDLWRSSFLSKSNVPQPLFTACTQNVCNSGNRQAITNAPRVGLHPEGGVLVYVGTGQFFDWYDRAVSVADPVNTFYGIWDNGQPVGGRDHLLQQRFLALGTTGKGLLYRTSSDEPIEWYDGVSGQHGWYIDLIDPSMGASLGERLIAQPSLSGKHVSLISVRPHEDPCQSGGQTFVTYLNATTGGRPAESSFDINEDLKVNNKDMLTVLGETGAPSSVMLSGMARGRVILQGNATEVSIFNLSDGSINQVITSSVKAPTKILWRRLDESAVSQENHVQF